MSVITSLSERRCRNCGTKLSRYNPDPLCWSCQDEKRSTIPDMQASSSLPTLSFSSRSAFTLRSILNTVRRTKPLRLSDVGQTLKNYRSIHQLTQRDLASLLGFDQSYISKLENGQGLRDSATLRHIAQRLGISGSSLGVMSEEFQHAQSPEIIDTASSVIRLSQTVRESGRAEAAAHVAAGLGGFQFVDLDTPMLLAEDPFTGGYQQRGGVYDLANVQRGLGIETNR